VLIIKSLCVGVAKPGSQTASTRVTRTVSWSRSVGRQLSKYRSLNHWISQYNILTCCSDECIWREVIWPCSPCDMCELSMIQMLSVMWLCGDIFDLQSTGCCSVSLHILSVGKLFTHVCFCHQFGTGQRAWCHAVGKMTVGLASDWPNVAYWML